jgi:hypothetical protein
LAKEAAMTDMSTDGPTPPPCDADVFKSGSPVLIIEGLASNRIEGWVKKIAERSGQRVDWHFAAGRAIVKALGDLAAVDTAIAELMPEYNRLRIEERAACT